MAKAEKKGAGPAQEGRVPRVLDGKADADADKLFRLLDRNASTIGEIAELRQEIGEATKCYLDATGHNTVAIGIIARLNRQTPEKRADVLATLDKLLPLARRRWMRNSTPDMFDPDRADPDRPTDPDAGDDLAAEMGAGTEDEPDAS